MEAIPRAVACCFFLRTPLYKKKTLYMKRSKRQVLVGGAVIAKTKGFGTFRRSWHRHVRITKALSTGERRPPRRQWNSDRPRHKGYAYRYNLDDDFQDVVDVRCTTSCSSRLRKSH
jgi:hypothetical protein